MHEYKIARDILKTIMDEARYNNFTKIKTIRIEVGELNGLTEDQLQFVFELEARGTIAKNAKLEMKEVQGAAIKVLGFDGE